MHYIINRNSFIPLRSAYESYYHNQEPLITNYSYEFIGCLDYIFFNPGSTNLFEKEGVQELPPIHFFLDKESLPSTTIPSDHLPLELLGQIHSMKREAMVPPQPKQPTKTRAEMNYPFFKHVYDEYFCLLQTEPKIDYTFFFAIAFSKATSTLICLLLAH